MGHGRIEERKLEVISTAHCRIKWPGLMQVGRITRQRTIKSTGKTSIESTCFITSLPESSTTPEHLLELNRNHWGIENKLHWVKDNVFLGTVNKLFSVLLLESMRRFFHGQTFVSHIKRAV
ncbi:MAG: transposase [Bacteroidetes bacterium]|nr:transposase [Bacteroidota bacterium]